MLPIRPSKLPFCLYPCCGVDCCDTRSLSLSPSPSLSLRLFYLCACASELSRMLDPTTIPIIDGKLSCVCFFDPLHSFSSICATCFQSSYSKCYGPIRRARIRKKPYSSKLEILGEWADVLMPDRDTDWPHQRLKRTSHVIG